MSSDTEDQNEGQRKGIDYALEMSGIVHSVLFDMVNEGLKDVNPGKAGSLVFKVSPVAVSAAIDIYISVSKNEEGLFEASSNFAADYIITATLSEAITAILIAALGISVLTPTIGSISLVVGVGLVVAVAYDKSGAADYVHKVIGDIFDEKQNLFEDNFLSTAESIKITDINNNVDITLTPSGISGAIKANVDYKGAKYVVQSGDTLSEIAQTYGTTIQTLQSLNNFADVDNILVGDELILPSDATFTLSKEVSSSILEAKYRSERNFENHKEVVYLDGNWNDGTENVDSGYYDEREVWVDTSHWEEVWVTGGYWGEATEWIDTSHWETKNFSESNWGYLEFSSYEEASNYKDSINAQIFSRANALNNDYDNVVFNSNAIQGSHISRYYDGIPIYVYTVSWEYSASWTDEIYVSDGYENTHSEWIDTSNFEQIWIEEGHSETQNIWIDEGYEIDSGYYDEGWFEYDGNRINYYDETYIINDSNQYLSLNNNGNTLLSGSGNDVIWGGDAGDTINGGGGNDILYGGGDNDILYGGSGSDTLIGGAGSDILYGGNGSDNFIISGNAENGPDIIIDETEQNSISVINLDSSNQSNSSEIEIVKNGFSYVAESNGGYWYKLISGDEMVLRFGTDAPATSSSVSNSSSRASSILTSDVETYEATSNDLQIFKNNILIAVIKNYQNGEFSFNLEKGETEFNIGNFYKNDPSLVNLELPEFEGNLALPDLKLENPLGSGSGFNIVPLPDVDFSITNGITLPTYNLIDVLNSSLIDLQLEDLSLPEFSNQGADFKAAIAELTELQSRFNSGKNLMSSLMYFASSKGKTTTEYLNGISDLAGISSEENKENFGNFYAESFAKKYNIPVESINTEVTDEGVNFDITTDSGQYSINYVNGVPILSLAEFSGDLALRLTELGIDDKFLNNVGISQIQIPNLPPVKVYNFDNVNVNLDIALPDVNLSAFGQSFGGLRLIDTSVSDNFLGGVSVNVTQFLDSLNNNLAGLQNWISNSSAEIANKIYIDEASKQVISDILNLWAENPETPLIDILNLYVASKLTDALVEELGKIMFPGESLDAIRGQVEASFKAFAAKSLYDWIKGDSFDLGERLTETAKDFVINEAESFLKNQIAEVIKDSFSSEAIGIDFSGKDAVIFAIVSSLLNGEEIGAIAANAIVSIVTTMVSQTITAAITATFAQLGAIAGPLGMIAGAIIGEMVGAVLYAHQEYYYDSRSWDGSLIVNLSGEDGSLGQLTFVANRAEGATYQLPEFGNIYSTRTNSEGYYVVDDPNYDGVKIYFSDEYVDKNSTTTIWPFGGNVGNSSIEDLITKTYNITLNLSDSGTDMIIGGIGNDVWIGNSRNNIIIAGSGDDLVLGGNGSDYLYGGDGNDQLIGGSGNDIIYADLSDPTQNKNKIWTSYESYIIDFKGSGDDILEGGEGDDYLFGGIGRDVMLGGSGNDSILISNDYDYSSAIVFKYNRDDSSAKLLDGKVVSVNNDNYLDLNLVIDGVSHLVLAGDHTQLVNQNGSVSVLSDGNIVVAWRAQIISNYTYNSWNSQDVNFIQVLDATGQALTPIFRSDYALIDSISTSALKGGGFVVTWKERDDSSHTGGLYFSIFDANYNPIGSNSVDENNNPVITGTKVTSYTDWRSTDVKILSLDNGGFVVTWEQPSQYYYEIDKNTYWAQEFDANGNKVGAAFNNVQSFNDGSVTAKDNNLDVVFGESGDDVLMGDDEDNIMDGGADNDQISGGGGNDELYGGTGSDYIKGDAGRDIINGGDGEDIIDGGDGDDILLNGSDGNDIIAGGSGNDLLRGGQGDDKMSGGEGDDILFADSGNDELYGGDGKDVYIVDISKANAFIKDSPDGNSLFLANSDISNIRIFQDVDDLLIFDVSSKKSVRVDGGAYAPNVTNLYLSDGYKIDLSKLNFTFKGEAEFNAEKINSSVYEATYENILELYEEKTGDYGIDVILSDSNWGDINYFTVVSDEELNEINNSVGHGYTRKDTRNGTLFGGDTYHYYYDILPNILSGTAKADRLIGAYWGETVNAGAGDDVIYGAAGNDIIQGGDGNDLISGNSGDDTLYGGAGHDLLSGDVGKDTLYGGDGNDTIYGLSDSDTIFGGEGNDYISGGFDADNIHGDAGNDFILGDEGDDIIHGDAGDDIILGGKGDDIIYGDDGDDYIVGDDGRDIIYGGRGNDVLIGGSDDDSIYVGSGSNIVKGGSGNDLIDARNSSANSVNSLDGGTGDDRIYAGLGSSNIFGDIGNDYIEINGGLSQVLGGMGNDEIVIKNANGNYSDGGSGYDKLNYSSLSSAITISSITSDRAHLIQDDYSYKSIELLTTTNYNDIIYIGSEVTEVHSEAGNDTIYGGDGNDVIYGGDGDDVIYGGKGDNTLSGGNGNDIFVISEKEYGFTSSFFDWDFYAIKGADTISDFDVNEDRIDLSEFSYLRSFRDLNLNYYSSSSCSLNVGFQNDRNGNIINYGEDTIYVARKYLEEMFSKHVNLWQKLIEAGYISDDNGNSAYIEKNKINSDYLSNHYDEDLVDVIMYLYLSRDSKGGDYYNNNIHINILGNNAQLTADNFIFANAAPIANSDEFYLQQDDSISFSIQDLLGNDFDEDAFSFSSINLNVSSGTLSWQDATHLQYQADANFNGIVEATYTITDSHGENSDGKVKFYVLPDFDITQNTYVKNPGEVLFISDKDLIKNSNLKFNGFDFSISNLSPNFIGSVLNKVEGGYNILVSDLITGSQTLSYDIVDSNLNFQSSQQIQVYLNSAPIDLGENVTLQEDGDVTVNVMANASDDVDNEIYLDKIVSGPKHGTSYIDAEGNVYYKADKNYYGSDSLTYKVTDKYGASTESSINFTVSFVEDGPERIANTNAEININAYKYFEKNLTFAGRNFADGNWNYISKYYDAEHDQLSFNIKLADGSDLPDWLHFEQRDSQDFATLPDFLAQEIFLTGKADNTAPAKLNLILEISSTGQDGITRTLQDNLTLNIGQTPLPVSDKFTINEEQTLFFTPDQLMINDPSNLVFRYLNYDTQHGTLKWNGTGYQYTPDKDFYGQDSFHYNVDYQYGEYSQQIVRLLGEVRIIVNNVNDNPDALNNEFAVVNGKSTILDLGLYDSDNDVVTIISANGNGSNSYSINSGKLQVNSTSVGVEDVVVQIQDSNGAITNKTIKVTTVSDGGLSEYLSALDTIYVKSMSNFSLDLVPDNMLLGNGFSIILKGVDNQSWLTYNQSTGVISGIAEYHDISKQTNLTAELWYSGIKIEDYNFSTKVISNIADFADKLTDQVAYINQNFYLNLDDRLQDEEDFISYNLTLANGEALPSWLSFDQTTGLLTGSAPNNAAKVTDFHLEIISNSGETVTKDFKLNVENFASLDWSAGESIKSNFTQLANGNVVCVWQVNKTIVGSIFSKSGEVIIPEFEIYSIDSGYIATPEIDAFSDGGFAIGFHALDYSVGSNWYFYGAKFDANGNSQDGVFQVGTYGDGYAYTPDVKVISEDLVAITRYEDALNKAVVEIVSISNQEVIATTDLGGSIAFDMVISDFGKCDIFWRGSAGIYTKSFDQNNGTFSSETLLTNVSGYVNSINVAAINSQKTAVSIVVSNQISLYVLDNSTNVLSAINVINDSTYFRYLSDVTVTESGLIGVSWHEKTSSSAKYSSYMQFFTEDGSKVTGAIRLNDNISGDSQKPIFIKTNDGQLLIYWESSATGNMKVKVVDEDDVSQLPLIPFSDYSLNVNNSVNISIPDGAFNGNFFTYSLTLANGDPLPDWITFDEATKTIIGNPVSGAQGTYNILVTAINELGNISSDVFSFEVKNSNPSANSSIANVNVNLSESLFIDLPSNLFSDQDGDNLNITLTLKDGTPADWLSLDLVNNKITGIAPNAGKYDIILEAKDDFGGNAKINFSVGVTDANYIGNEYLINTTRNEAEYDPEIVILGDNRKINAWNNGGEVKIRVTDQENHAITNDISIATGNIKDVEIIALTSGNALLAWRDGYSIYAQEISNSGYAISSKILITNSASYSGLQGFEKISLTELTNGERLVSWSSGTISDYGDGSKIYAQKFTTNSLSGSAFSVSGSEFSDAVMSNVMALSSGKYAVTFFNTSNLLQGNSTDWSGYGDVRLKIYNSDGSAVSGAINVGSVLFELGAVKMAPDISESPDGSFMITYQDYTKYNSGYNGGIYARKFDSSGNALTSEFKITSSSGYQNYTTPQLAWASSDYMIAVWGEGSGSSYNVYGRYFDKNGNAIGEQFLVSNDYVGGANISPTVKINSDLEIVISWQGTDLVTGQSAIINETIASDLFPFSLQNSFKIQPFKGESFSYNLLNGIFDDTLFDEVLNLTLADGSALPSWMTFSSETGILSGIAPNSLSNSLNLKLNIEAGSFSNQIEISFEPEDHFISSSLNKIDGASRFSDAKALSDEITLFAADDNLLFISEDGNIEKKIHIDGSHSQKIEVLNSNDILLFYGKGNTNYIQHFNSNGASISQEIELSLVSYNGVASGINSLYLGDNKLLTTYAASGPSKEVMGQIFDIYTGEAKSDLFAISNNYHYDYSEKLATAKDGTFFVVWNSEYQESYNVSDRFGVYMRQFSNDGDAIGDLIHVNDVIEGAQRNPDIAISDSGNVVVSFYSAGDIYFKIYDSNGNQIISETKVSNGYTSSSSNSIEIIAPNKFLLNWYSGGTNYAQIIDDKGSLIGDAFIASTQGVVVDTVYLSDNKFIHIVRNTNLTEVSIATFTNDKPIVNVKIEDQTLNAESEYSLTLPPYLFMDAQDGELDYTLSSIPSWLSYDSLTNSLISNANIGDVGNYNVIATAIDSDGNLISKEITFTVKEPNKAPEIIQDISDQSIEERQALSLDLSQIFTDTDSNNNYNIAVKQINDLGALVDAPSWLTLNNKILTSTLTDDAQVGSYNLRLIATDEQGLSISMDFNLNVLNVNDLPVANFGTINAFEDNELMLSLANYVTDADGDNLSYSIISNPLHANVFIDANNILHYSANTNYFGNDNLTISILDSGSQEVYANILVNVNAVNDAPILINSSLTREILEDGSFVANLLTNAYDVEGDNLAISQFSASHGIVTIEGGKLTYVADENYNGLDSVSYTISDGNGGTVSGNINVIIDAVNDAPILNLSTANTNEDSFVIIDVLAMAVDAESDSLEIISFGQGKNGLVSLENGKLKYVPFTNFNGTDKITYEVTDGVNTVSKEITINVSVVNDKPIANLTKITTAEDASITIAISTLASDIEDSNLTLSNIIADDANISVSISGSNVIITPINNFYGTSSFTYTVIDSGLESLTQTVEVVISSVNDAPIISGVTEFSALEDQSKEIDLLSYAFDIEGDNLSIISATANGTVTISDNKIYYKSLSNFFGIDRINYTISDGNGGITKGFVNVNVAAVNDAPIFFNYQFTTYEDAAITFTAADLAYDIENDNLTIVAINGSSDGIYNGVATFTPIANFIGQKNISVTVRDSNGAETTKDVIINVNPNDAPVFESISSIQYFETRVNSSTLNNQTSSTITSLTDGGWVIAWTSNHLEGFDSNVYIQRYSKNGEPIGDEAMVFYYSHSPAIAALSDGGWIVSFEFGSQIYTQRYLSDGSAVGDQTYLYDGSVIGEKLLVNTDLEHDKSSSKIIALKDGGWVVSWESYQQDGSGYGVYAQRYTSDGQTKGAEFRVNSYTYRDEHYHSISALDDGGWIVTWTSESQDGSGEGVYAQRYSSDGNAIGEEFIVNSDTLYSQNFSVVTSLSDGGWVIVWRSSVGNLHAQRYLSDGQVVGGEFVIDVGFDILPEIAMLKNGDWIVTWSSQGGDDYSGYGVYAQRYSSDGNIVGEKFVVNTRITNDQSGSKVTALEDGGWVISWQSYQQDGVGYGVYSQRYAADGSKFESIIETSPTSSQNIIVNQSHSSESIAIEAVDYDNDLLTYSLKSGFLPQKGEVIFDQIAGTYNYIPNTNENGNDSFVILINDGNGGEAELTVNVTINSLNNEPTTSLVTATANEDILNQVITISFNGSDIDIGDSLTYEIITNPSSGLVTNNNDGTFTFNLNNEFQHLSLGETQDVFFLYKAIDASGASSRTTAAVITITGTNDAPTASNISVTIAENSNYIITTSSLLKAAEAFDIDGDSLSVVSVQDAQGGSVFLNSAGNIIFTPLPTSDTLALEQERIGFTYTISDGKGAFVTKSIDLTISQLANNAPVANSLIDSVSGKFGNLFTYTIPEDVFIDEDNDILTYSATLSDGSALPDWLIFNQETKTFTGTPPLGIADTLSILLIASDAELSASQTFNLDILSNVITGTSNNDTIHATSDNDEIYGGEGDDQIIGGAGADIIYGGRGNDVARYEASKEAITINLETNINTGGDAQGDTLFSIENILATSYDDNITGDSKDNTIYANSGDDIVNGGAGNDVIYGGKGSDIINGGAGKDILFGGSGNDIFTFTALEDSSIDQSDLISDFSKGQDKINLSNLGFINITDDQDQTDGSVLTYEYDNDNNQTYITNEANTFKITLNGIISLDVDDFYFG